MKRPPKKYVCEKCGYLGDTSKHEGCDYLAWTTGEQLYIDQLERELALLKASPASASVAAPDYRIADRGFRWDAENRQHIPQLLIEFTPVPENAPNASSGWKDRDKLAAMLVAAPTPPVSEDRKDAENSALKLAKTKLSWITKRANYLDVLDIAREANEAIAAIDALGE